MVTCQSRIKENLIGRMLDFKVALNYPDSFTNWFDGYALGYYDDPRYRAKRIELSWGGPADYFLLFDTGEVEYHFLDWFDHAEIELDGEDLEVMERVRELLS